MISQQQARRLAELACDLRPTGARHWDPAGVMAAIRAVAHLDLGIVTGVVTRAAENPRLDTPGAIGNTDSPEWRIEQATRHPAPVTASTTTAERQGAYARACTVCGQPEDKCRRMWADDHEYKSNADHDAKVAAMDPMVIDNHLAKLRSLIGSFGKLPDDVTDQAAPPPVEAALTRTPPPVVLEVTTPDPEATRLAAARAAIAETHARAKHDQRERCDCEARYAALDRGETP